MFTAFFILSGCAGETAPLAGGQEQAKGVASCSLSVVGPVDGMSALGPPQFAWDTDCDGAVLELSADGAFATATTLRFGALWGTSFQHAPDRWQAVIDMMGGTAHWRLVGSQGADTTHSETRTLALPRVGTPLEVSVSSCSVSVLDPADGAFLDPASAPTFRWSDDCEGKVLQLSSSPTFDLAETLQFGAFDRDGLTVTEAIWTAMSDRFSDAGYWRVVAGTTGDDVISDVRSFSTTNVDPTPSNGPVLWFTDQESAQEGTPLTIRGYDLGSDGTVWFGDVPATEVFEWSTDRIVVTVPDGAGSPVEIDVDGETSNGLQFATHTGRVLWVDVDASSAGDGSESSPFRDLQDAIGEVEPGDTVLISEGRYLHDEGGVAYYMRGSNSGEAGMPVTYRSIPGHGVVLDGSDTTGTTLYISSHYVVVSGLEVTEGSPGGVVINGDHVRVVDNDIFDNNIACKAMGGGSGLGASNSSEYAQMLGNRVSGNGCAANLDHGIYVSGHTMHIAYNEIWGNLALGITLYNGDNDPYYDSVIESNVTYDNGTTGILISRGSVGTLVQNNVSYHNGRRGLGLEYGPEDTTMINNTMYDNDNDEIRIGRSYNTVLWNNVGGGGGVMLEVTDSTEGLVSGNNLWDTDSFQIEGSSADLADLQALGYEMATTVDDPEFVDTAGLDFRLAATSPGIDSADSAYSPTGDHTGRTRDGSPDLGAYELLE